MIARTCGRPRRAAPTWQSPDRRNWVITSPRPLFLLKGKKNSASGNKPFGIRNQIASMQSRHLASTGANCPNGGLFYEAAVCRGARTVPEFCIASFLGTEREQSPQESR